MTPFLGQRLRAERGFERLYSRHAADVYRYSLALLRNPTDAEDVTQTTFLNAYRAYRNGERPAAPRAWLIAIAHNVCRQRFRTAQRRVEEVAYEDGLAEATVPDPEAPGAEDIRRALSHLAFNQRAALVMRELEGRSYAEIAEVLELSASAVETLLFRARRALREQLEGAYTCGEAERAISKQLDGRLSRAERSSLRAHLRACDECAALARRQRAQRSAVRSLGLIPLPSSLAAWGGGAATGGVSAAAFGTGGGVALKAAAVLTAGTVAVGVGHEVAVRAPAREAVASPRPAAVVPARSPVVRAAPMLERPAAAAPAARAKVPAATEAPRSTRGSARSAAVHAAIVSRSRRGTSASASAHAKAKASRSNGAATSAAARERARARAAARATVKAKAKAKATARAAAATKAKPHARAASKPQRKGASTGGGNGGGNGSGGKSKDALPAVSGRG